MSVAAAMYSIANALATVLFAAPVAACADGADGVGATLVGQFLAAHSCKTEPHFASYHKMLMAKAE